MSKTWKNTIGCPFPGGKSGGAEVYFQVSLGSDEVKF